ncbi:GNAT family N-acetyltransferase [Pseudoroseomonas ludipueritiae]|uniref:GNAT family N-acetyltransferase n=1 Tax=Pseudoroseomonas ludipueritiae TaxID=198093 RepID=A0ABR7R7W0_9PROT|nr:GNAT family N-acetyltransferase [Pseudoroseomonas ludipueritiae]
MITPVELSGSRKTVFQEAWWLQAASGGALESIAINWGGSDVASLSFVRKERPLGIRSLVMPPYTRTLGPVLSLPPSTPSRHCANLRRVAAEIMLKLPRHDHFSLRLDCEDETAFAFALAGCSVSEQFTFRVEADADPVKLMERADRSTARLIRAANRRLKLHEHADFGRFVDVAYRHHPAGRNSHDFQVLERLFAASTARGQAIILGLTDAQGRDAASVLLVWGHGVLYYLVPHRDRERSGGDANALLLWNAMEFALDRGLAFDVDGYHSVGTASFLSSFGFPRHIRHVVTHCSLRGALLRTLQGWWRNREVRDLRPDPLCGVQMGNARLPQRFGQEARPQGQTVKKVQGAPPAASRDETPRTPKERVSQ